MTFAPLTTYLASTKVEKFAAEVYRLEAGDILDVLDEAKRHTLLLCLLHYVQVRTRDRLTTMFLKRMYLLHNNARKRLRDVPASIPVLRLSPTSAAWLLIHPDEKLDKTQLKLRENHYRPKNDNLKAGRRGIDGQRQERQTSWETPPSKQIPDVATARRRGL